MNRITCKDLLQSAIVLLFFRSSEEEHITAINELEFLIEDYIDKLAIPIEEGADTVEPGSAGSFYYYNMPYEEYKNKYPFFSPPNIAVAKLKKSTKDKASRLKTISHEIGHYLQYRLGIEQTEDYADKVLLGFMKKLSEESKAALMCEGKVYSLSKSYREYFQKTVFDPFALVERNYKNFIYTKLFTKIRKQIVIDAFEKFCSDMDRYYDKNQTGDNS